MHEEMINDIYLSLQGLLTLEATVPGVPDLFTEGSFCDKEYTKVQESCRRLCARLGVEEDSDLTCLLDSLEHIQAALCREMFRLGMKSAPVKGAPLRMTGFSGWDPEFQRHGAPFIPFLCKNPPDSAGDR